VSTEGARARGRRRWLRVLLIVLLLGLAGAFGWRRQLEMPGSSYSGPPPAPEAPQLDRAARLMADVRALSDTIGTRSMERPEALERAALFVEQQLQAAGLPPRRESYTLPQGTVSNVLAEVAGGARQAEWVLVGAHYDTVDGSPGADDNASGVAALLELARALADSRPARSLRLLAFVNREPPHYATDAMGSLVHARACRARGEQVVAMLSLDCLGFYSQEPGSQELPEVVASLYPDVGNYLAVVGNLSSSALVKQVLASFRAHATLPSEGSAAPGGLPGVGWSDHWAFWELDYPAVVVTDTGPFRNPDYHGFADTSSRLDVPSFTRAVDGLEAVLRELLAP